MVLRRCLIKTSNVLQPHRSFPDAPYRILAIRFPLTRLRLQLVKKLILDRKGDRDLFSFVNSGEIVNEGLLEGNGETIKVDASDLIARIVVSPDYPAWAIPSLQKLVTCAGLKVSVEESDLLRLPYPSISSAP